MGDVSFDLLTIGHSNQPAEQMIARLRNASVTAVADVRTLPFSRRYPWFSQKALTTRLALENIAYLAFGAALGGRPRDPALYCAGVADYEAIAAQAGFREGLDRLAQEMGRHRVCLMGAEREPLDCHRCLLVGRALAERGCRLSHILGDGAIEPHAATEERLLGQMRGGGGNDLFDDRSARLADAYRRRARAAAARLRR